MLDRALQVAREGKDWLTPLLPTLLPQQRELLIRVLPVLVASFLVGGYFLLRVPYRPVAKGLSFHDSAAVIRELEAQKIPYRVRKDGSVVEVPEKALQSARARLADKGLGMSGGAGFEIFEESGFGQTQFTQRINFLRALQGELSRTISALDAVETGRVHLALPIRSAFLGPQEQPSASVVVGLRPGSHLSNQQVQGIVNLVSNSVPSLVPEKVTVVDASGALLRPGAGGQKSDSAGLYQLRLDLQRGMEERIETMLEPVLGPGKSVARVSMEIDFRHTELTREEFDPSSRVIRSQQQQVNDAQPAPGGVPGVDAVIPPGAAEKKPKEKKADGTAGMRKNEMVTYEVGRTTRRITEPRGQINRLSVAVMVDGKYEEGEYVARTAEEMESLKTIVKRAVGFNAERGDELEVTNIPFRPEVPLPAGPPSLLPGLDRWIQLPEGVGVGAGALLVILILSFLGTKLLRRRAPSTQEVQVQPSAQVQEAREELEKDISGAVEKITITADPRQEQLIQVARDYKEVTVQIIRMWLREGRKSRVESAERDA